MKQKFLSWYKELSPRKRLLLHFIAQWVYWFICSIIIHAIWPDEKPVSLLRNIFYATWMSVFMTAIFNWKTVKTFFKKTTNDR